MIRYQVAFEARNGYGDRVEVEVEAVGSGERKSGFYWQRDKV